MFGLGGLFGKIFGTDKAITSVIDHVASGLDKLSFTDQEKSEAAAADRSEARQMVVRWMESTQGQNLARRLISLAITGVWLFQYVVAWLMEMIAVFLIDNQALRESLTTAAVTTDARAESMNGAVMLILAFYFAAPHMGDIVTAAIQKFGGSKQPVSRGG